MLSQNYVLSRASHRDDIANSSLPPFSPKLLVDPSCIQCQSFFCPVPGLVTDSDFCTFYFCGMSCCNSAYQPKGPVVKMQSKCWWPYVSNLAGFFSKKEPARFET